MTTSEIEEKQALRLHRFLMALMTYGVCAVVAQISAWLGYLPWWLPVSWAIGTSAVNGVLYWLIRSGRNLQFRDPSMTEMQLIFSMIAAMAIVSQAQEARGAFVMFVPVPLLFGVLRLNFQQMLRVGVFGLILYASVIFMLWYQHPERIKISLELLYLIALAAVMVYVCLMCSYISAIRAKLTAAVSTINELARRDALTGLYNRRDFTEKLSSEMSRYTRQLRPGFAVCLADVDRFKSINDRFGHPVGDEVLAVFGKCLGESVRATDYVARYGGEEFVLLLDAESQELALQTCERIRQKVEQLRFEKIPDFSTSVSIGMAYFIEGESADRLIERADVALYEAKTGGRNCVRVAAVSPA